MKLTVPTCRKCGEPAAAIEERLLGDAYISKAEDGSFEYDGETEICWDSQETVISRRGLARVGCSNHHYWKTRLEE